MAFSPSQLSGTKRRIDESASNKLSEFRAIDFWALENRRDMTNPDSLGLFCDTDAADFIRSSGNSVEPRSIDSRDSRDSHTTFELSQEQEWSNHSSSTFSVGGSNASISTGQSSILGAGFHPPSSLNCSPLNGIRSAGPSPYFGQLRPISSLSLDCLDADSLGIVGRRTPGYCEEFEFSGRATPITLELANQFSAVQIVPQPGTSFATFSSNSGDIGHGGVAPRFMSKIRSNSTDSPSGRLVTFESSVEFFEKKSSSPASLAQVLESTPCPLSRLQLPSDGIDNEVSSHRRRSNTDTVLYCAPSGFPTTIYETLSASSSSDALVPGSSSENVLSEATSMRSFVCSVDTSFPPHSTNDVWALDSPQSAIEPPLKRPSSALSFHSMDSRFSTVTINATAGHNEDDSMDYEISCSSPARSGNGSTVSDPSEHVGALGTDCESLFVSSGNPIFSSTPVTTRGRSGSFQRAMSAPVFRSYLEPHVRSPDMLDMNGFRLPQQTCFEPASAGQVNLGIPTVTGSLFQDKDFKISSNAFSAGTSIKKSDRIVVSRRGSSPGASLMSTNLASELSVASDMSGSKEEFSLRTRSDPSEFTFRRCLSSSAAGEGGTIDDNSYAPLEMPRANRCAQALFHDRVKSSAHRHISANKRSQSWHGQTRGASSGTEAFDRINGSSSSTRIWLRSPSSLSRRPPKALVFSMGTLDEECDEEIRIEGSTSTNVTESMCADSAPVIAAVTNSDRPPSPSATMFDSSLSDTTQTSFITEDGSIALLRSPVHFVDMIRSPSSADIDPELISSSSVGTSLGRVAGRVQFDRPESPTVVRQLGMTALTPADIGAALTTPKQAGNAIHVVGTVYDWMASKPYIFTEKELLDNKKSLQQPARTNAMPFSLDHGWHWDI